MLSLVLAGFSFGWADPPPVVEEPATVLDQPVVSPLCAENKAALKPFCQLHGHLLVEPLSPKKLKALLQKVGPELSHGQLLRLRARLLAVKAFRSRTCLRVAGSSRLARQEGRLIVRRFIQAMLAYDEAIRSVPRGEGARLLPELAQIVRRPYELVARGLGQVPGLAANSQLDLIPPRLLAALQRLGTVADKNLAPELTARLRIEVETKEVEPSPELSWQGDKLIIHRSGDLRPQRLEGEQAVQELTQYLESPENPWAPEAARLTGILGLEALKERLVFLADLEDQSRSRPAMLGLMAMGRIKDQDRILTWAEQQEEPLPDDVQLALGFFGERIRGGLQRYRASRLRADLLAAILSRSAHRELRGFYDSLLGHEDPSVRILAHAALRELQPLAWVTQRLMKDDNALARCAARNLVDLFPLPSPSARPATSGEAGGASATTAPAGDAGPELVTEPEGSVQIPEDAPMDGDQAIPSGD